MSDMWIIPTAPKMKQKVRLQWTRRASEWERGPGPRVSLFSSVWILIVQRLYGGGSLTLYLIYANTLASIHSAQNSLLYVRSFSRRWRSLRSGATFDPWSHSLVNCGEPFSPRLQSDTISGAAKERARERENTPWDVCRKLMLQTQWFCSRIVCHRV